MAKSEDIQLHQSQPLPSFMACLIEVLATGALVAPVDGETRENLLTRGRIKAARSPSSSARPLWWHASANVRTILVRSCLTVSRSPDP